MKSRFAWDKTSVALLLLALIAGCSFGPAWVNRSNLPTGRLDLTTSVLDGKIYVIGGYEGDSDGREGSVRVEVYDPSANTWQTRADLPTGRGGLASVVMGGKIYTMGGSPGSAYPPVAVVEVFDPQTGAWSKLPDLLEALDGAAASQVDGRLFVIGGTYYSDQTQERISIASVEEFDPQANAWVKKADMPTSRYALSAGALNGKIYAIGGMISTFQMVTYAYATPAVEVYDPQTDSWEKKADMPAAKAGAAMAILNGKIYIFGGTDSDLGDGSTSIYVYDPVKDAWTSLPDMPLNRFGLTASLVNGKIYITGGSTRSFPFDAPELAVWEYRP